MARISIGKFRVVAVYPAAPSRQSVMVVLAGQSTLFSPSWRNQRGEARAEACVQFTIEVSEFILPQLALEPGVELALELDGSEVAYQVIRQPQQPPTPEAERA